MIWNETKECMSRDEMDTLQSARLVKLVNRVYHNVVTYQRFDGSEKINQEEHCY